MPFNQYKTISQVLIQFSLSYQEANFLQEKEINPNPHFLNRFELMLREGVVFNSEAAICEAVIFPILAEVWLEYRDRLLIWSHQPLSYDSDLSGVPDYIVAQRSVQGKVIFEFPCLILVEAKKDNFEEGWGQCSAEMVAAQKLNGRVEQSLYGIVSNGKIWEFAQLNSGILIKNIQEYSISHLNSLFGVLHYLFNQILAS